MITIADAVKRGWNVESAVFSPRIQEAEQETEMERLMRGLNPILTNRNCYLGSIDYIAPSKVKISVIPYNH